eukprot:1160817-Pelagomonas_calceolata.AAC.2
MAYNTVQKKAHQGAWHTTQYKKRHTKAHGIQHSTKKGTPRRVAYSTVYKKAQQGTWRTTQYTKRHSKRHSKAHGITTAVLMLANNSVAGAIVNLLSCSAKPQRQKSGQCYGTQS